MGLLYFGTALTIIAGIGMLKGKNWARFLYVGWSAINIVIGLATSPMMAAVIPVFTIMVAELGWGRWAARTMQTTENASPERA